MKIHLGLRETWHLKADLRKSCVHGWGVEPAWSSLVVETAQVSSGVQRLGIFKAVVRQLQLAEKPDLLVVEAVQQPFLRNALCRWGFVHNPEVNDFYWLKRVTVVTIARIEVGSQQRFRFDELSSDNKMIECFVLSSRPVDGRWEYEVMKIPRI